MALRALAQHVRPITSPCVRYMSTSATTVFDRLIQIYALDDRGNRHTVRAIDGTPLPEALYEYGFDPHYFMPHPFDTCRLDCHVYVGNDYLDRLPKLNDEQLMIHRRQIEDYVRLKARPNSRMGYFIPLNPHLNGMTVAIGEIEPWQTG